MSRHKDVTFTMSEAIEKVVQLMTEIKEAGNSLPTEIKIRELNIPIQISEIKVTTTIRVGQLSWEKMSDNAYLILEGCIESSEEYLNEEEPEMTICDEVEEFISHCSSWQEEIGLIKFPDVFD